MGGKVYAMDGLKIELKTNICLVEKCLRLVSYSNHSLYWNDPTEDCVWNCLARISRFHYPTLSLVSKGFRSLIASPELEATRSFIGETENHLCVCLNLNKNNNYNPRWFTLSPIAKQKLKSIPWHRHQYPKSSTVVANGSDIYIVGGFVCGTSSKRVFVFDSRSHQWRRLHDMRLPRVSAVVNIVDKKIYVIGGYKPRNIKDCGEVYDPNTQTWEPLLPTTVNLTIQNCVVSGGLVMGGKRYTTNGTKMNTCFVELENLLLGLSETYRDLVWRELKEDVWRVVRGLEQLSHNQNFTYVGNSGGGRRVAIWWKSMVVFRPRGRSHSTKKCKTEIWCAEISVERRGLGELWGRFSFSFRDSFIYIFLWEFF
uniref:Putative F-box/kelch-repeat protein At5g02995 n=2 Tax=Arabidopsis thaliana TaxID=3702 RepID=FK108_ARATH|nr:RecName: Full=Putative F-box/kelch-repeat protein At5g02995 [Arabidopsis thaliana]